MKHTLLAVLMALLYAATLNAQNRGADSLALVDLYCQTNGLFWTTTWNLDTLGAPPPMDEWYGVTLTNGRVTCLDLDGNDDCMWTSYWENGNNLSGILPDLNLPELQYLYLSHNHLTDAIPEFTHLNNLVELYLDDNHFTASMPDSGLNSLRVMNLERNYLTVIPDFTDLTALEELNLNNNHITEIPDAINLSSLLKLYIAYNHLFEAIPNITGLPALEELNLSHNHLSGALPNFEDLSELRKLLLNNNYLSGEVTNLMLGNLEELYLEDNRLTSVPDFTDISNLQTLDLDKNSLNTVPNFDGLPNLLNLYLAENHISSVPLFGDLVSLNQLHLNDNCLSGTVPDFETPTLDNLLLHNNFFTELINFTDLNELEELDLSNTNLQGTIPNFTGLDAIETLNLSHNCLSGEIPVFDQITQVQTIDLSHNSLTGDVPDCNGLNQLQELNLSFNQLDDNSIPDFSLTVAVPTDPDACPLSQLKRIYLNNNMLSGLIPHFEQLYNLEILDLSYNNFSGNLPSFDVIVPTFNDDIIPPACEFADAYGGLQELRLNNNDLSGIIFNVANLVELRELNLSHNNLNGNIFSIGNLIELRELNLSHNILSQNIPTSIGNLVELRDLYLNNNNLIENIPSQINQLVELEDLYLHNNQLTALPLSISNLIELDKLYLNSNNIGGPIPENYFNGLYELDILNLGYNNFGENIPDMTGTIQPPAIPGNNPTTSLDEAYFNDNQFDEISSFAGLSELDILHLDNNQFSGMIPDFSGLSSLDVLYLDNNQFSGMIPGFEGLNSLDTLHLDNNDFEEISLDFADNLNSSIDYLTLYDNLQLIGCYDPSLYILRYKNFDSDSISNGTNFSTTWDVFSRYNTDGCDCVYRDRRELMRLYDGSGVQNNNGLEGESWSNNTNWGSNLPIDTWHGITVNGSGCVIGIDLSNNNLDGVIPNDLLLLDLENLNLSNNEDIEGGIPQWIAELDSLQSIDLSNCSLSGCLPDYLETFCGGTTFSNATISNGNEDLEIWNDFCNGEDCSNPLPDCVNDRAELIRLYIATNSCDNWIIKWDTTLLSMEDWHGVTVGPNGCVTRLDLTDNGLAGEMPQDMNLPELTSLNLTRNDLIGPLPDFEGMAKLQNINLSENHFTGNVPDFDLPMLDSLNLSSNALISIPTIPDFSGMPLLRILDISSNHLSGTIPNFSNLPNLLGLYLNHNDLNGIIPPLNNLTMLTDLELNNNNLSGNIPNFNLPNLNDLQLQYNNLIGDITNFTYLSSLNSLSLNNNNLSNMIPNFDSLYNLSGLNLSNNNLSGVIPEFYNLPKLNYLNASNNNLSGEIPNFTNSMNFNDLRISYNNITGEIPDVFAQNNITVLIIHDNLLSGCYDPILLNLCENLRSWSNENNDISDGNGFIIPWEDFCDDIEFSCDSFEFRIALDMTDPTTCDNNNGSITLNVNYGQPPYQFEWSGDTLTTFDPNNLSEGTYMVTVTDCYGGIVADTIELFMPSSPLINAAVVSEQAYCEGVGSFTATVSEGMPNYQYNLVNSTTDISQENDPTFENLLAGAYTLYVTDALNCRDTTTVQIEGSAIPQIEAIAPLSTCEDEDEGGFTIDIVSEGTAPYQYSINGGTFESNEVFSNLESDNYTIIVQDVHNCRDTLQTLIDIFPPFDSLNIDTITTCGLDEGMITITPFGSTAPFYYSIDNGDSSQEDSTFTNLTANTFNIIVEDANGCTTTDQVILAELPPLEISIIDTSAICQEPNGSLEIVVSGGTADYQYSLDGVSQSNNILSALSGDSTYTILVEDAIGCTIETTATIDDTPLPVIGGIDITHATCQMTNASIEVFASQGSGDFMYHIQDSISQNVSVFDELPGAIDSLLYSIIVTDQFDCADTIKVRVGDTPRVDFDTLYIDTSCGEENGRIDIGVMSGTHPYTYDFNGGVNEISSAGGLIGNFIDFTDLAGGDYFVTITDSIGCQEDTMIRLAISEPLSDSIEVINDPCIGDDNCGEVRIHLSGWNNPSVVGWDAIINDSLYQTCVPVGTTSFEITDADNCRQDSFIYFEPLEYHANVMPESAELRIGVKQNFEIINAIQADWSSEEAINLSYLTIENNGLEATFTAPASMDNSNGCEQSIIYEIVAYNTAGNCKDTLILPIRVLNEVKIPAGITPNNDTENDILEIPVFDNYDNIKFAVFNRWGDRVYQFIQKEDRQYEGNEWDGTYHTINNNISISTGRKLPDGDYFYTLQFGNCPKIQKGTIFIR